MNDRSPLPSRQALQALSRAPEPVCIPPLVSAAESPPEQESAVHALAMTLARGLREQRMGLGKAGLVQSLLQEFALNSQEGVALMCLAEALLRIPDQATRDALVRDKIGRADWHAHLGHSESIFVNAASWGLLLTGKLMATHSGSGLEAALRRVLGRGGEPVIRKGLDLAMRLMGEQFVAGQTITQAVAHAQAREALGFRYSYDMLGEAAMTMADAQRYRQSYEAAIDAIGAASRGAGVIRGPGISIKLSALHPRYTRWQAQRVHDELYPVLLTLAQRAAAHDIGLNIDAEESERLEISLDLLERLCSDPSLAGWQGLGFVIQAYQKRCPAVVTHLISLARATGRRLMVRLVKGAYWDSEIKRAQTEGQMGFPVYTRKAYTDVSYLACARALLDAPDAIFPQFATHNAHTVASVIEMARARRGPWEEGQYEFQCLHGMGEPLYEQIVSGRAEQQRPCRIYAPVGTHETLLAYLVRRLLENGANTSFVNRVANLDVPLETLVENPVRTVRAMAEAEGVLGAPHAALSLPADLLGTARRNSRGQDLHDESVIALWERNAIDRQMPAVAQDASAASIELAVQQAQAAWPAWSQRSAEDRSALLEAAAERLEATMQDWLFILAQEAGKTLANGVAEVREAVDFLRYYAQQARACAALGPFQGLGPVVCISPWNFPLAIFIGQVAAALAAGNTVLAKPAEQTPRVADRAARVLWDAGVPKEVLHLVLGPGETAGAALVADVRVQGVLFTGSTEVARLIQAQLAGRLTCNGQPVPLVAETGGQNAMIVDSSALLEQVTADVLTSAFDSAGQRCSALRVLCVQEEIAEPLLTMIRGAVEELSLGPAHALSTDVGPLIDESARTAVEQHVSRMQTLGFSVWRSRLNLEGSFVAPTLIEIPRLDVLQREVFGPVLHVLRFSRDGLADLLHQLRDTGYGLTMGVHSRIDETIASVVEAASAGNVYVNRNMVGAVVGVQPFGGQGLSGTGPKAGGPLYLLKLMAHVPPRAARHLVQSSGLALSGPLKSAVSTPTGAAEDSVFTVAMEGAVRSRAFIAWLQSQGHTLAPVALSAQRHLDLAFTGDWRGLPGPTGETNAYAALPREAVLCLADDERRLLHQTGAALAVGSRAIWSACWQGLHDRLPESVATAVTVAQDWQATPVSFDAVLVQGSDAQVREVLKRLVMRPGPIVGACRTFGDDQPVTLHGLVLERSVSVNTAAAGGNASLMTIG
ncbi:MAG: L-glutamate gamma-semialdehyde dehydrogenase [Burkholderiaceae bacterium]